MSTIWFWLSARLGGSWGKQQPGLEREKNQLIQRILCFLGKEGKGGRAGAVPTSGVPLSLLCCPELGAHFVAWLRPSKINTCTPQGTQNPLMEHLRNPGLLRESRHRGPSSSKSHRGPGEYPCGAFCLMSSQKHGAQPGLFIPAVLLWGHRSLSRPHLVLGSRQGGGKGKTSRESQGGGIKD